MSASQFGSMFYLGPCISGEVRDNFTQDHRLGKAFRPDLDLGSSSSLGVLSHGIITWEGRQAKDGYWHPSPRAEKDLVDEEHL